MGLLDWLSGKKRSAERGRRHELRGELDAAVEAYLAAEMPADAARVLLCRADAEPDVSRRLALCGQAATVGAGTEVGQSAARRRALMRFDLAKGPSGVLLGEELRAVAAELALLGQWEQAAEAYRLLGDGEAEIKVLESAGAIDRLEARLAAEAERDAAARERAATVQKIGDLAACGERRAALELAATWLARGPDEQVQIEAARIRGPLCTEPTALLEIDGEPLRVAFGEEATVGRAEATVVVCSDSVSRQHLRLGRRADGVWVEDLQTRNGTTIAGARLGAAMPVGAGLRLLLAGQVECVLEPSAGGDPRGPLLVRVGGTTTLLPLGPLRIRGWSIDYERGSAGSGLVLRTLDGGSPPILGRLEAARVFDLAVGDTLAESRGGPVVLRVLGRGEPGEEPCP